jgi:hypothetical protein
MQGEGEGRGEGGPGTDICNAPMQIFLQIRNNVFPSERGQLHALVGDLLLDMLDEGISNDGLACHTRMGLFLALAVVAAARVGADDAGWGAEIEDVANLGRCVCEAERDVVSLRHIAEEYADHEWLASKGES